MLKIFRDWWDKSPRFPEDEPRYEQPEIWQWQINVPQNGIEMYPPMPKSFGLLVGRFADAEARLKASVSIAGCYRTKATQVRPETEGYFVYKFFDAEIPEGEIRLITKRQRGAIRCVSKNLMLLATGNPDYPHDIVTFVVEEAPNAYDSCFAFHPIKMDEEYVQLHAGSLLSKKIEENIIQKASWERRHR